MPFHQEVVNWTGDSVAGRLIPTTIALDTGVIAVIVVRRAGAFALSASHTAEVGTTYRCGTTTEITTTGIQSFEAGGFRVGAAAEVNSAGQLYTAIVWRDTSAGNDFLRTGFYAGNGINDRLIPVGFQPTHVWVLGFGWAVKTPEMPADGSVIFAEGGGDTTLNAIKSITATGFTVGNATSQVNASLINYAWLALKTTTEFLNFFKSFKHVGVGGSGQIVSGFLFTPSHAYCQRFQNATSSPESFARGPQHAGADSLNIQLNTIDALNGIRSFGVGQLELGNVAAPAGVDVYGYAVAASGSAGVLVPPPPGCPIVFPTGTAPADVACVAPVLP